MDRNQTKGDKTTPKPLSKEVKDAQMVHETDPDLYRMMKELNDLCDN